MRYQRNSEVLGANLGADSVALLDAARENYIGLEGPASRIWQLLDEARTLDEICAVLIEEYDVEAGVCQAETRALIDDLVARRLVVEKAA